MATKLNWGLLATGNIAKKFAKGVHNSRTGSLVAVASRSKDKAEAFGDEFDIPRRHGSYEALLADKQVQAVYVATPHPLHPEWAVKAAEAGKHILCEKPAALNYPTTMAMIEAARRHDVFFMEAYMYRCAPQTARLVELVGEGAIGEVRVIRATFSFHAGFKPDGRLFNNALGGGGILDVGGYTTSLARLVAGAATGEPFAEPVSLSGCGKLAETGVDQWAIASARFPGDIVAQLSCGVSVAQDNAVDIFGSEGRISVPWPWIPAREGGETTLVLHRKGGEPETINIPQKEYLYALEADTVADHLEARQAPAMSWEDTLGNMRMLDAWRAAVGVEYELEKPGAVPTVHGRPLKARDGAKMAYGRIDGVDKDIARLVMGCDNQKTMPQAAMLWDDYFESGGNCFDTAFTYGRGTPETLLGRWLTDRDVREQVVLISKGAHTPHCNPEAVGQQLDECLQRLRTDYADIYFLHRDNPEVPVGEFVDALNREREAGRLRIFGGSNWSMQRIEEANEYAQANGLVGFTALSNQFSLARMVEPPWKGCLSASTPEFRQWLERTGMPLMPWSSQARGFFAGRADPDDRTTDPELVRCWYAEDNFRRLDRANELADKYGVPTIAIALAYVLAQPFPTFPLIGPRSLTETRTSLQALDVELNEQEIAWLNLDA
jgi:predicted dehydrogenase/aryl-alcohol dehydrogenase-like predicted oxidoreductase